jgi:membrane associated rhomboid family serine protease
MIPLRDNNPTHRTPVVTYAFIAINVLVFLYQMMIAGQGEQAFIEFVRTWAFTPADFLANPIGEAPTLITSIFMHGGWAHLLGNMLYLWIFGDNIEDILGHGRFILFYLLTGIIATFAQMATNPASQIPMLGASGAIAGILGAYLLEFPHAKVTTIVFRVIMEIRAIYVLGFWFVFEFIRGITALGQIDPDVGGVAFFAHIGGFIAGLVLIRPFRIGTTRPDRQQR